MFNNCKSGDYFCTTTITTTNAMKYAFSCTECRGNSISLLKYQTYGNPSRQNKLTTENIVYEIICSSIIIPFIILGNKGNCVESRRVMQIYHTVISLRNLFARKIPWVTCVLFIPTAVCVSVFLCVCVCFRWWVLVFRYF